ncbi:MAG: hypothetical protein IH991_08000 [Planctomycetes bacterium]|nr:hypothetical protein [Planctomycetota bacterium]
MTSEPTEHVWNNFLITGFGRSGTMFLAAALNRSLTWEVTHEPEGKHAELSEVVARFARDNYGEVNSQLRKWLPLIPAKHKAVIIRHPQQLALSVYNRHPRQTPTRLHGVWQLLDDYITSGYQVFRFEHFTGDIGELQRIATWAGIEDLELPRDILEQRVNATHRMIVSHYDEIPEGIRNEIDEGVSWFQQKYY